MVRLLNYTIVRNNTTVYEKRHICHLKISTLDMLLLLCHADFQGTLFHCLFVCLSHLSVLVCLNMQHVFLGTLKFHLISKFFDLFYIGLLFLKLTLCFVENICSNWVIVISVSPYLKTLSMVASTKLLHLLEVCGIYVYYLDF